MTAAASSPGFKDQGRAAPRRRLRFDIQALRAIAVTLVVVYHLDPAWLPGGYIGVDVFFVISGYLITSHLIREAARSGRVRLGAFWAARARRILPASLVAIAVTIALTLWVAPVTLFENLWRQALASIFYVQNWVLAADSVDYSASENAATPFQHFWSLSVEEQFYLFWPLLVLVGVWIAGRRLGSAGGASRESSLRQPLLVIFGVVVVASLAYSILSVARGDAEAYFVTTTRIWELGAGGLLATFGGARLGGMARRILTYGGLALIAFSAVLLTTESPFPGIFALPVVVGTIAVIMAGTPSEDDELPAPGRFDPWRAASHNRAVLWVGDRSYSLYLWHFPVIILWPYAFDRDPGVFDLLLMAAVSLVLSDLSFRFIEQPVRTAKLFASSTPITLVSSLVAMLLLAGATFTYLAAAESQRVSWQKLAQQARDLPELGAATVTAEGPVPFPSGEAMMVPSPLKAQQETPKGFRGQKCVADQRAAHTPECVRGDKESERSIALVGDSHARMYGWAINRVAKNNDLRLRSFLHLSCPFSPTPKGAELQGTLKCTEPNAETLETLLADPPEVVITTWAAYTGFTDDGSAGVQGSQGFAEYWAVLEDAGIDVLILRDVPTLDEEILECVASNYERPDACAKPRTEALRGEEILRGAVELEPRVNVADFTDLFCDDELCRPVIGNVLAYRDYHHLTATYAATMVPRLEAAVFEVLAGE